MNSALPSFLFSPIIAVGLAMAMPLEPPEVAALGHIGVGQANLIKRIDFCITGFGYASIFRQSTGAVVVSKNHC
jgi:hypothetical protein